MLIFGRMEPIRLLDREPLPLCSLGKKELFSVFAVLSVERSSIWLKKNSNQQSERIEIHLQEALLVHEPLEDILFLKEQVVTLEKVEFLAQVDSFSSGAPLFRVILIKRLDLHLKKRNHYVAEQYSDQATGDEKTLFFASADVQGGIQIKVGLDEFDKFLPSGFLVILASFAQSLGFFDPFLEHLDFAMKEMKYSMMDKIATLFSSIVVGSSHLQDINHKLNFLPAGGLFVWHGPVP